METRWNLRQRGLVGYLTRWKVMSLFTSDGGHDHQEEWTGCRFWRWISRSHGGHGRKKSLTPEVQTVPRALSHWRQAWSKWGSGRSSRRGGPPQLCLTSVCWSINFLLGKPSLCLRWPSSCAQDSALRVCIRNLYRNLYADYLTRLQARIRAGRCLRRVCACCTWESSCNQGCVTVSIMHVVSPSTPQRLRAQQRKCASPGDGAGRLCSQPSSSSGSKKCWQNWFSAFCKMQIHISFTSSFSRTIFVSFSLEGRTGEEHISSNIYSERDLSHLCTFSSPQNYKALLKF